MIVSTPPPAGFSIPRAAGVLDSRNAVAQAVADELYSAAAAVDGGVVSLLSGAVMVDADQSAVYVGVLRDNGNTAALTVDYTTVDGTLAAGTGYTQTSGALTFAAGEAGIRWIRIPLLSPDVVIDDYFHLRITSTAINPAPTVYQAGQPDEVVVVVNSPTRASDVDAGAIYVNNATGDDQNAGTGEAAARATLQEAILDFEGGIGTRIILQHTGTPYTEIAREDGVTWGGPTAQIGGGANDQRWMRICSDPRGPRVTIDQQNQWLNEAGTDYVCQGFLSYNAERIMLYDLHITRCQSFAYQQGGSAGVQGIMVLNGSRFRAFDLEIDNVRGQDNSSCIRFDYHDRGLVHHCLLHHTYDGRSSSNLLDAEAAGLHAGVHGFGHQNLAVEYSTIHTVRKGVQQKTPNDTGQNAVTVRFCRFSDIEERALEINIDGAGASPSLGGVFARNEVDGNGNVLAYIIQDGTNAQASGFRLFGNSLYRVNSALFVRAMADFVFCDNLVSTNDVIYPNGAPANPSVVIQDSHTSWLTTWTVFDRNTWHNLTGSDEFVVNRGGGAREGAWNGLAAWSGAYGADPGAFVNPTDETTEIYSTNPDANSSATDPQYADPANGNLIAATPGNGHCGLKKGARAFAAVTQIGYAA